MGQRLGAFFCCLMAATIGCAALASVADAGWLPPVAISEAGEYGGVPHVVLDSEGNATAVWDLGAGAGTEVESAFRPAGESWEAPIVLSNPEGPAGALVAPGDGSSPSIAVDAAGDVTVIWESGADGTTFIEAVERPAGGSWTEPVVIGEMPTAFSPEPWVAVDAGGDAVAVWTKGEVIQSAYRPAGEGWEAPVAVSGAGGLVPQAAMNAAGDATVVWMQDDGGRYEVKSAFRPAAGEWEARTVVSQAGEEGGDPQIAIDAAGDTLVAWRGEDSGVEYVRTAFRPVGGEWEAPTDASSAGEEVESIEDAVDPDGNAIVAWAGDGRQVGEYANVHAAFRPAGGAWEAPGDLSTGNGNGYPTDLVFDQSGNAALVWEREATDASAWIIEAAYRPGAAEWEAPVQISEESGYGTDPTVVLDAPGDSTAADGDATAVWIGAEPRSCEGPKGVDEPCYSYRVQAAGYDPEGLPEVSLELPSEAEVGEPVEISMSGGATLYSPSIDFGDGVGAPATEAAHVYSASGEYEVSGAGAEVLGYSASARRTIKIVGEGEELGPVSGSTPSTGVAIQQAPSPVTGSVAPVIAPPAASRPGRACLAARSDLRADRRRLKHAVGAKRHRERARLAAAARRARATC